MATARPIRALEIQSVIIASFCSFALGVELSVAINIRKSHGDLPV